MQTVLNGLVVGESPRWHNDRLWLANWGAAELITFDPQTNTDERTKVPASIPFSIDWFPDGRLLAVDGPNAQLLRQEPDGSLKTFVDLSNLARGWNEIVVDRRANIYVNGSNYRFAPGEPFEPGIIALVTPDGQVRQVADDIHFPNGM